MLFKGRDDLTLPRALDPDCDDCPGTICCAGESIHLHHLDPLHANLSSGPLDSSFTGAFAPVQASQDASKTLTSPSAVQKAPQAEAPSRTQICRRVQELCQ